MKKTFLAVIVTCTMVLSFRTTNDVTWTFDGMHSQVGFSVTMLGISDVNGTFKISEANLVTHRDDFSDASVAITVDIKSVDTDVDDRDKHLRTADFFDAEKFPTAQFKSKSFTKSGTNIYKVTGDLTMHGVTKAITWEAIGKTTTHPMTNKTVGGFRVTGKINRRDFGISTATPAEMLADEVILVANLQFVKN